MSSSCAGIFYRNALNLGLPVIVCDAVENFAQRDLVHVDPASGVIENETRGVTLQVTALPPFLAMIADGGLVPHLENRFAARRAAGSS